MTGIWTHKLYHVALLRLRQGHFLWEDHYIYGMNTYRFGIGFYPNAKV